MIVSLADLKLGQKGVIVSLITNNIPLKLLEMGCLPGNEVTLLHTAPFKCPMYLNVNGSHLAIRRVIAKEIEVELSE